MHLKNRQSKKQGIHQDGGQFPNKVILQRIQPQSVIYQPGLTSAAPSEINRSRNAGQNQINCGDKEIPLLLDLPLLLTYILS